MLNSVRRHLYPKIMNSVFTHTHYTSVLEITEASQVDMIRKLPALLTSPVVKLQIVF